MLSTFFENLFRKTKVKLLKFIWFLYEIRWAQLLLPPNLCQEKPKDVNNMNAQKCARVTVYFWLCWRVCETWLLNAAASEWHLPAVCIRKILFLALDKRFY